MHNVLNSAVYGTCAARVSTVNLKQTKEYLSYLYTNFVYSKQETDRKSALYSIKYHPLVHPFMCSNEVTVKEVDYQYVFVLNAVGTRCFYSPFVQVFHRYLSAW